MAEDKVANGVVSTGMDDQPGEEFTRKIEALERERDELVSENAGRKEEIKMLTKEIEGLRSDGEEMREKMRELDREVEQSQDARKAAQAIAARAAELETEVARLQHDSISEMSAAEEATTEAAELRKVLEDKELRVEFLEREVKGLKQEKAESDMKVRDLERKLGILEMKEIEERSKRIRVEEELREKVEEKERDIGGFRQKVEELEKDAAAKKTELEVWVKEKNYLEEALRISKERARSMESNVVRLRGEAGEAEEVIKALKEKAVEAVNGAVNGIHDEEKGLKLQWPVVAAGSAGAVAAAAAVLYLFYGKRR